MGLSWQQGPLAPGAVGRFLVPGPLPDRMLFAEPLRRRMRVRFGGDWIADSEDVVLLHEPGRYPVAYFPLAAVADGVAPARRAHHPARRPRADYLVHRPGRRAQQAARRLAAHRAARLRRRTEGPGGVRVAGDGGLLRGRRADRRPCRRPLPPHRYPADQPTPDRSVPGPGHSRHQAAAGAVRVRVRPPLVRPPRRRRRAALTPADGQTFCPYKGLASYYDIADARRAAWSYEDAWTEVRRVSGLVSFEPDKVEVHLDGARLRLEPGQSVIPHGIDRELTPDEIASRGQA